MKKYIKMNTTNDQLSLGNLFRFIKEVSVHKKGALQTELFCILFDTEYIYESTVNNYCVGARQIGDKYRKIYVSKRKEYLKDHTSFYDTVIGIISCMEGLNTTPSNPYTFIQENKLLQTLCSKLRNVVKNDQAIDLQEQEELNNYYKDKHYYEFFVACLLYIVLEHKQPQYKEDMKKEVLDMVLEDTSMSSNELQEYLSLKLKEGIHYEYSLKQLGLKGNAYANFELGSNEYYGYTKGYPRYEEAYKYLKESMNKGHAASYYMVATMYLKGYMGAKKEEELSTSFNYFKKAASLGNTAALNTIGNFYKEGIYPVKKDLEEALIYYKKAASKENVFAYNNLGKYYESIDFNKSLEYYLKSADLEESWACNKVGEYYRKNKEYQKAFDYYQKGILGNHLTLCYYNYYNLAKYFYKEGCLDVVPVKNETLATEYFKLASDHGLLEATLELFEEAIQKEDETSIKEYQHVIENHPKYNKDVQEKITQSLQKLSEKEKLSLKHILENK